MWKQDAYIACGLQEEWAVDSLEGVDVDLRGMSSESVSGLPVGREEVLLAEGREVLQTRETYQKLNINSRFQLDMTATDSLTN